MSDKISLLKKIKTKEIAFNGGTLEVKELTFNQVQEFSKLAKESESVDDLEKNRSSLGAIIREGVVGLEDISDEDLGEASLTSLKELSEAVLEFNGLKVADIAEDESEGNDSVTKG